jgi:hypothetical protein
MQDATRESNEQQSKSTSLAGILCWGGETALRESSLVELKWVSRIALGFLDHSLLR